MGWLIPIIVILGILVKQSLSKFDISRFQVVFANDSAIGLSWVCNLINTSTAPSSFVIEYSIGPFSQDFYHLGSQTVPQLSALMTYSFSSTYTATNLAPSTGYRFRVITNSPLGVSAASDSVNAYTLSAGGIYWEPIMPRRVSLASTGAGFSDPVLQRPHLDPGPEVYLSQVNYDSLEYSDPPSSEKPVLPSGRRGHSLTSLNGEVFMFGGRTNGITLLCICTLICILGTSIA
jgi:hypothetical protein